MPAIHQVLKPSEIASVVDLRGLGDKVITLRPFHDQFSHVENAAVAAKREAAFAAALETVILPATECYALKLVPAEIDGKPMQGARLMVQDPDKVSFDFTGGHQRVLHQRNIIDFMTDAVVAEGALGAVEFDLVAPSRPSVSTYRYDPADADHYCV